MPINTANLQLYKKDPVLDKKDTFNIELMLNQNWDKIENDSVFNKNHREDTSKHVTSTDKEKWDGYAAGKASSADLSNHAGDTEKHVTSSEKINWNGKLDASAKAADSDRLAGQLASYYTNIVARLGYTPLDAAAPSVDSERVGGYAPSTSPLANTAAIRNANGGLEAVVIRQTYPSLNANIGTILTQISTTDGYVRPTTPAQLINALKLLTESNYGNVITTSASFTLNSSQKNSKVYMSTTNNTVITIPPNMDAGYEMWVKRMGTGTITFVTGSGVNLYSIDNKRSIKGVYGSAVLTHRGNNVWTLDGSLE